MIIVEVLDLPQVKEERLNKIYQSIVEEIESLGMVDANDVKVRFPVYLMGTKPNPDITVIVSAPLKILEEKIETCNKLLISVTRIVSESFTEFEVQGYLVPFPYIYFWSTGSSKKTSS